MGYGEFNIVDMLEHSTKSQQPLVGATISGIQLSVPELLEIFNWKTFVVDENAKFIGSIYSAYSPAFFFDTEETQQVLIKSRRGGSVAEILENLTAEVMADKIVFVLSLFSSGIVLDPLTFTPSRALTIRYATLDKV